MNIPIISRGAAAASGAARFFTGRPCKYGHVSERFVSSGACVECGREATASYQKTLRETRAANNARQAGCVALPQQFVRPEDVAQILAFLDALNAACGLQPAIRPGQKLDDFTPFERFRQAHVAKHPGMPLYISIEGYEAKYKKEGLKATWRPGHEPSEEEKRPPVIIPPHMRPGFGAGILPDPATAKNHRYLD